MNSQDSNPSKSLSGFHFSFASLQQAAEELITTAMQTDLVQQTNYLKTMIDTHIERSMLPDKNIRLTFLKFKTAYRQQTLETDFDNPTLLRRLSYCLTFAYDNSTLIIENEYETQALLNVLNMYWRDSFIIGLFSSMIQCWECENRRPFERLHHFIITKIKDYQGERPSILRLKAHVDYYQHTHGPEQLSRDLFDNRIGALLAPEYLGLPRRWIEYEYFSKIIAAYFEQGEEDREARYFQIFRILEIHTSKTTAKRIISRMIVELHQEPNLTLQSQVKQLAFKRIGDPAFDAYWTPPHSANEAEIEQIEAARKILNGWITAEFIAVFFETCLNDERRKNYWLRYAKSITHFRVIGSKGMLQELEQDKRIKEYLPTRFQALPGRAASKSAIMMRMNKYTLVEFSDTGFAFYAYRQDHPHCPAFNTLYTGLEELRDARMPIISISDGALIDETIEQGRLRHANEWEKAFDVFLNEHVL